MLHSLQITSTRHEDVPVVAEVLAELDRVAGYAIPAVAMHYSIDVRVPYSASLRMAWSGPELAANTLQVVSRRWPRARFDLGRAPVGEQLAVARETFVNGADVGKIVNPDEREKEQNG